MMFQASIRLIFRACLWVHCMCMMPNDCHNYPKDNTRLATGLLLLSGCFPPLLVNTQLANKLVNKQGMVLWLVLLLLTMHGIDAHAEPSTSIQSIPMMASATHDAPQDQTSRQLLQLNVLSVTEQWVDNEKALVMSFSQNLSPKLKVNRFITITQNKKAAKGKWQRFPENSNSVYFSPIVPNQAYTIFIRPGLKSDKGLQLLKPYTHEITSDDYTPSLMFDAQGQALSPAQYGRLALQSTGMKQLKVRLFKLDAQQTQHFSHYLQHAPKTEQPDIDALPFLDTPILQKNYNYDANPQTRQQSLLVWDTLTAAQQHQTSSAKDKAEKKSAQDSIPANSEQPSQSVNNRALNGLYVLHIKAQPDHTPSAQTTSQAPLPALQKEYVFWFNLSDVMLSTQQYDNEVLINFFSQQDGKVLPDLTVTTIQGEQQKRYTTDRFGQVRIKTDNHTIPLLVQYQHQAQNHLQFIHVYPHTPPTLEPNTAMQNHAVLFLDKPNYTQGETVKLSALVVKHNQLLTRQDLEIRLRRETADSQPNYLYRKLTSTNEQGLLRLDYTIGKTLDYGNWLFEVALPEQPAPLMSQRFGIWSNANPDFQLTLHTPTTTLAPTQSVTLHANATSAGNELKSADTNVQLQRMIHLARQPFIHAHPTNPEQTQAAHLNDLHAYVFGNSEDQHLSGQESLPDLSLSAKGKAQIKLPAINNHISSPLLFTYQGTLMINHTAVAQDRTQQVLWPDQDMIGIRALFDPQQLTPKQGARFNLVRVNREGQRSAVKRAQVRLIKRDNFLGSTTVAKRTINLQKDQPNELVFPVDESGDYRLEVLDPKTDLMTSYDFIIHESHHSSDNPMNDNPSHNTDNKPNNSPNDDPAKQGLTIKNAHHNNPQPDNFSLKLDKAHYQQGETVNLTIQGQVDSDVLVSLESDQILWQEKIRLHDQQAQTLSIPLDKPLLEKLTTLHQANHIHGHFDNQGKSTPSVAMHELTITVTGFQREPTTTQWQRLSASIPLFIIPKPTLKSCELDTQDRRLLCQLPERKAQVGWVVLAPIFAPSANHASHHSNLAFNHQQEQLRPIFFGASGWTTISLSDWLVHHHGQNPLLGLSAQLYMPNDPHRAWQSLNFMLPSTVNTSSQ
ncbi:MAG: hypothetical protein ACWA5U_05435 [bacterium]